MRIASNDSPNAAIAPDEQPRPSKDLAERQCILTGAHGTRSDLIRLMAGPDGTLWPDLAARLPGRGLWIGVSQKQLGEAIQNGKFRRAAARALKSSGFAVADDLPQRIATSLQKRALDRLGLEHRAGHLIFGTDKLSDWIRSGRIHLLLHASDAASDGAQKLAQAQRVADFGDTLRLPADRETLSRALGRENVVHSGVTDGKAAARIRTDLKRWLAYLDSDTDGIGSGRTPADRTDEGQK